MSTDNNSPKPTQAEINRRKAFARKLKALAKTYNLPPVASVTFTNEVVCYTADGRPGSWVIVNGQSVCIPLPSGD
jgi:hypothetical protein